MTRLVAGTAGQLAVDCASEVLGSLRPAVGLLLLLAVGEVGASARGCLLLGGAARLSGEEGREGWAGGFVWPTGLRVTRGSAFVRSFLQAAQEGAPIERIHSD